MPHISTYDLTLDSDDEEEETFLRHDGVGGKQRRKMLVDEILEQNDAKLEQEKSRKLEEERVERGAGSTDAKALRDLSPALSQLPTNEPPQSDLFTDLPLENTFKASSSMASFVAQTSTQRRPSVKIPKSTFTIQNRFGSRLFGERPAPQPNPKVFVRISDCAQTAAPIRVRIREGSVTEMEPEKEHKPVTKAKNESPPKPAAKMEDPFSFSDLPSDLLPGLYELPNLGFSEGSGITNADKKDVNSIPKASQLIYEKHIHAYSKTYDQSVKDVNSNEAKVLQKISDRISVKTEPVEEAPLQLAVKGKPGTEEDDGSYVVIVIPKHATVEDVMRTLRTAGNQQATSKDGTTKIMLKRKPSLRSPRKTYIKRIKKSEEPAVSTSPSVIKTEQPTVQTPVQATVKPAPKSALNASCTLAAMSMLAAAEKGISGVQVGSMQPVDPEVITIEECMEEATNQPTLLPPHLDYLGSLDPKAQHNVIEFGLFNDHTYATLQFRYTIPHVTLPMEQPVPEAAVTVTINTDVKEEVKESQEIPTSVVVKKEVECKQEEVVVKKEKLEETPDDMEVEAEAETDVEKEDDSSNNLAENLHVDDAFYRRSRRLSLKTLPKWGPGGTLDGEKASKKEPNKPETVAKQEIVTRQDPLTNKKPRKSNDRQEPMTNMKPSKSSDEGVKWQLFPSKLRCRLCEVMCRQLIEMKHHIVQIHGNQEAASESKTKRTRNTRSSKMNDRVLISDIISDFEVSALSAIVRLCPTCDKYVPESRIANHLENHAALTVTCEVCKAAFKNQTKLGIHKDICNSVKTDCKCKACGKEYSSRADLGLHQRFSHQETQKKKRYQCKRCHKVCRSVGALKVHVAVHFTVKPYECSDCGKGFSQKINMEYHRRIHSGDHSFQCDLCPEAFAQAVNLKTHKKKKHGSDMLKKRKL